MAWSVGHIKGCVHAQVFVDVTAEVQARIQRGFLSSTYNGHIHTAEARLVALSHSTHL